MSLIRPLVDYDSSDSEQDDTQGKPESQVKRQRTTEPPESVDRRQLPPAALPPLPDAFLSFLEDKGGSDSGGRIRTTPHVDGNWASYVFVSSSGPLLFSFGMEE